MSGISDGLWKSYVGKKVSVADKGAGTLLYYGITTSTKASGIRKCGIELEAKAGKHDGKVNGQRYFTCEKGHGIITATENVTMLEERTATGGKILRKRGKGGGSTASTPSRTPKKTPNRPRSTVGTPSSSARKPIRRKAKEEEENEDDEEAEDDDDEAEDDEEAGDDEEAEAAADAPPVNRQLSTETEEAVARAEARKEELRQIRLKLAAAEEAAKERANAPRPAEPAAVAPTPTPLDTVQDIAAAVPTAPEPTPAAVPTTNPAEDLKARAAASYERLKEQAATIATNNAPATPAAPAAPLKRLARALGDFVPTKDDHLSLKTGEIVEIVDSTKRWWVVFNSSKEKGRVPSNFLKELDADTLLKAKAHAKAASQAVASPQAPSTPMPVTPAPSTPAPAHTPAPADSNVEYVVAKADFTGKPERQQLSMTKGEKMSVVDDSKNWWVVKNAAGHQGKVPSNYVEKI